MNENANGPIDEEASFLKLVYKHLKEKNCKRTIIEVIREFVNLSI
jgi:hypothetical protein